MPDSLKDRDVLLRLSAQVAEAAALDVHAATISLWKRLNRLERVRPPVWINEICWNEMGPELALECEDPFCRAWEEQLRRTLYQWRHLPADMVVEPVLWSPLVVHDSGFGLEVKSTKADGPAWGAVDWVPTLKDEADVEKIATPVVTVDRAASDRDLERLTALVGDVIPVRQRGVCDYWFSPWDQLIQYYGIEELYTDMCLRPALVHKAVGRMTDAMMARLDQLQAQNALALNNGYHRVGSGGLGYTDELPQADFDGSRVRPIDLWGTATAQIFSEVSPAMHEEFALRYELKWLRRFGLNCYGCCEPLHKKIGILRQIPRLRRISMSPFVNVDEGVAAIGTDYIFSHKPNPAVLASETWNPQRARQELRDVLEKTRGCVVEIILKDISTVRGEPERLWEWSRIAMEEAERVA
jgi:hypothetical protein